MTVLSLPGGIHPCAAQWALEHNVGGSQNSLGNTIQRIQRDGGRWRADLTFPTFNQDIGALFAGYLDKAARGDMWTYITPPHADARGNWGPDELVVNGDFTRDVAGWSAASGAALNVNARRLRVKVSGSPGAVAIATQTGLATEADQPHVVMVDLVKGSTANWRIKLYPSGSPSQDEHFSYYEDEGRVIFTHIPETSSTTIELACNSTTEQDYVYVANVSMARCLLVNDSLAVGNECDVKGGPTSVNGALKAGEFVTIQLWNGWQMVRLTEDLDTDSSGNGTIRFEPSLRDGVKGGGAVVVHKPFCRMIVPSHASQHAVEMPRLFGFSVSYVEDVTEIGIAENPQDTDLIWYWDAHSYSLVPSVGSGTPTITNGGKTYTDQSGVLKTTALDPDATGSPTSYLPAFNHNADGALKGQLIESARTNLAWPSEDLSHANWNKTTFPVTVTGNAATAPDGNETMDVVTATATSARHAANLQPTATNLADGTVYAASIWIQRGTTRYGCFTEAGGALWHIATFDFDTGSVSDAVNCSSRVLEERADGSYRIEIIFTRSTTTQMQLCVGPALQATNAALPSWSANGTESVRAWGAQIEAGALATSYIPTTSATATRPVDHDTLALSLIPGYNESAITVVVEAIAATAIQAATNQSLVSLDNGTVNELLLIRRESTASFTFLILDGGAIQAVPSGGTLTDGAVFRTAAGASVNDVAISLNGAAPATDTSASMPTPTTLRKGTVAEDVFAWDSHIRRLSIYKANKPNRQKRSLAA